MTGCNQDCATCLPTAFDFGLERPPVQVTVSEADGVHVAAITIPQAGTYVPQHSHAHEHLTMLAVGAMRVWVESELVGDFAAPFPLRIPGGRKHTFLALTDGVVFYCIHNIARTGAVEVLGRHELPGFEEQSRVLEECDDGVTLHEETFASFWRDGQALFAEHAAEVGPREGVSLNPNLDVIRGLERASALQIITARSNGRMFGYLATIVSPSLEDSSIKVGTQTVFFVSKDFRGLGPRLQRASLDCLTAKGVVEVIMRAGVRGRGPKTAALYRRLGAQPFGELFNLTLRAA